MTIKNGFTCIWSEQFQWGGEGWYWRFEMYCTIESINENLNRFKIDEPQILFKVSTYKPAPRKRWIKI